MKILAVDPYPERSAWVIYNCIEERLISYGMERNGTILFTIRDLDRQVGNLVIGMTSVDRMPAYDVCWAYIWAGRFIEAFTGPYTLLYYEEIELNLCGGSKGCDVKQALLKRLNGLDTAHSVDKDIWFALAIAVTYGDLYVKLD